MLTLCRSTVPLTSYADAPIKEPCTLENPRSSHFRLTVPKHLHLLGINTLSSACISLSKLFPAFDPLQTNMSSLADITSITNASADCFYFAPNQTRTEVTGDMLREMKNYSPGLLTMFCIVNIFLGFVSFTANALVVLTTVVFSELHIVANVGLASLATASLLHGSVLNSFLFAVGVNALAGGCPIFRSSRFVLSYVFFVLIYSFILSLCTVTAERLIDVVFSLRYHAILSIKGMLKFLTACWTVSFVLGFHIISPLLLLKLSAKFCGFPSLPSR